MEYPIDQSEQNPASPVDRSVDVLLEDVATALLGGLISALKEGESSASLSRTGIHLRPFTRSIIADLLTKLGDAPPEEILHANWDRLIVALCRGCGGDALPFETVLEFTQRCQEESGEALLTITAEGQVLLSRDCGALGSALRH